MSTIPSLTAIELPPHLQRALDAIKDLPTEQQQAVFEAAVGATRAASELRNRLYVTGTIFNTIGKR